MTHTCKNAFLDCFLDSPKVFSQGTCDVGQVIEFIQDHRPCDM